MGGRVDSRGLALEAGRQDQLILAGMRRFSSVRPQGILPNLLAFSRILRRIGIEVTSGRLLDVCRSLEHVDPSQRQEFYLALRANLVSSREELALFDRAFELFWSAPAEGQQVEELVAAAPGEEREQGGDEAGQEQERQQEFFIDDWAGEDSSDDLSEESIKGYSPEEVLKRKDFDDFSGPDVEVIKAIMSRLIPRIATKISRRRKPDRRGPEFDPRRTLRRNLKYAGDVLELARKRRRIKKTKLVLLCDVSGSMDCYSRFIIYFMYGLQHVLRRVETLVFSTRLTRITPLLKSRGIDEALIEVSRRVLDWSGGTDIGGCLQAFNLQYAHHLLDQRAVVILLSDGWDRGEAGKLEQEMRRLRLRAYKIIWLNPLLGSPNYKPLCKGMSTALPYVDYFLPAHNVKSLIDLGKTLRALWN